MEEKGTKYGGVIIEDIDILAVQNILYKVKKQELSTESLNEILDDLWNIVSETEYFDKTYDLLNEGIGSGDPTFAGILGEMKQYVKFAKDKNIAQKSEKILLKNQDNFYQYGECCYPNVPKSEVLANVMNLSNILAHIMSDTKNVEPEKEKLEENNIDINKLVKTLYNLKDFCIDKLIESKENKEILEIQLLRDKTGKFVFNAILPQYFEPFSAHCGNLEFTQEELEKYKPNTKEVLEKNKIMPFKVSPEKQEILEYIYRNRNDKELRKIKERIEWYFDAQERLEGLRQKQEIENKKKITGKKTETDRTGKNTKMKDKIDIQKSNRDFLQTINEKTGNILNEKMQEGFLHRVSYSLENTYTRNLQAKIYDRLTEKGVPEDKKEKEALKAFMYIRMNKNISMINSHAINGESLESLLNDAMEEYEEAFNFIESKKDEGLDYKTMIKELKKHMTIKDEKTEEQEQLSNEENKVKEEQEKPVSTETKEIEPQEQLIDTESIDTENQEKTNLQKIKEIHSTIKEEQEVKHELKKTIKSIGGVRLSLKGEIKKNKQQIKQLEDEFIHASKEDKQKIVEEIVSLRNLIEEEKSKRRELKEKRETLQNRVKEIKAKVKSARADLSDAIEDIEI